MNFRFFPEFERHAQRVISSDEFRDRFEALSRSGDRPGMIRISLEALGDPDISIGDMYRGKNEARSKELRREATVAGEVAHPDKAAAILTEALALAPSRSQLFFEILVQRARASYRQGHLMRCAKDCQYFEEVISRVQDQAFMEESRVDVLLLHSDCYKDLGASSRSNGYLNEAMRCIRELASKRCDEDYQGDDYDERFRIEKLELLKYFLNRKQQRVDNTDKPLRAEENVPVVEGKTNDFLSSCSDAIALGNDKMKGRFLYAVRDIDPGSVLIVDRPFSFSTDIAALHKNCLYCHASLRLQDVITVPCQNCQTVRYCSQKCCEFAWDEFHKFECQIFDYFYENKIQKTNSLLAYRTVITALYNQNFELNVNQEFLQVHSNDKNPLDISILKTYEPQDYKTVFSLETNCALSNPKDNLERAIQSIFFAKCLIYSLNYFHSEANDYKKHLQILAVALLHNMQTINCNAYEIVENIRDEETKILEPHNVGGAIYTSVSLSNHSCYPNIVRHSFPNGIVVVKSIRFISKSSEILDCYGQHFIENKKDLRRKLLAEKYYFKCQCQACSADWPMTLPNDQFNFKCRTCSKPCRRTRTTVQCTVCNKKIEISKFCNLLKNSIKKRLTALTKMYDGNYNEALPLLLEHAKCIDEILVEPSLEAIKTQQSIIQCLNATSSTSI
ncbi:PREDICTED: SET and MYND domain-containing protein 4-like [Ceratosolen solmsi marchali]|uniref:Protein-lysine N-methyltransferase SMYD4 n=1 Tax=Ceratosolen solmsi marchali TaxID=326594 RepID=A0AAJ6YH43_9HYME|nr:PREDICTED: SET and MYND domain-containing protein 4-like [Ceratosolen solmsi marchali]